MRQRLSLRYLLFIVLVTLSTIPVLLLGVRVKEPALRQELDGVQDKHLLLARSLSGVLERYAAEVTATFRSATDMALAGVDTTQLAELLRILHFRHICIADSVGTVLHIVSPGALVQAPGHIPGGLFNQIKDLGRTEGQVRFSGVILDGDRQPVLLVVMLLSHSQFAIATIDTDFFVALQKDVRFGTKGHAVIVDQYGKVLAHPREEWRLNLKDLSGVEPISQVMRRQTGTTNFFSPATESMMVAGFAPVGRVDWGIMVAQPLQELQDSVSSLFRVTMSVTLFGVLLAAALSWWLAGFLARPLVSVAHAARNMVLARTANPVVFSKNAPSELVGLADSFNRMVTHVSDVHKALTASEKRFRDFAETAADWFWELDNNLRFIYLSERYHEITNAVPEDALLRSHEELFESRIDNPAQRLIYQQAIRMHKPFWDIEISWQLPSGEVKVQQLNGVPILNDKGIFRGFRGSGTDVTEARSLSEQLTYQASHDELTGLVNRREFKRRLTMLIEDARATGTEHCLAFFDLDRFKAINDKCGHEAGDELLRQLGRLFAEQMRQEDTVARLGGDEFSLLFYQSSLLSALAMIKHLQQVIMDHDFIWGSEILHVGASFGVVPITRNSANMTILLKQADIACYGAKASGRNLIQIHSAPDPDASARAGFAQS